MIERASMGTVATGPSVSYNATKHVRQEVTQVSRNRSHLVLYTFVVFSVYSCSSLPARRQQCRIEL